MRRISFLCLFLGVLVLCSTAVAGTKEEIMRLQSDVLALQNQIRMLEKTLKEQTDGLHSLVTQLNDQLGKTNQILVKISATVENQAAGDKNGNLNLLQEVRNLASKVDDSSTRISALAQQIADMKIQAKPLAARSYQSEGMEAGATPLSPDAVYNEAFNDLVQGNLDLAVEGFSAFIKNFPAHEKADDAQYNIGEAYYNSSRLAQAIAAFTRVISDYATGDKIAPAYFKRAKAELAMQERENAIADFRTVIEKYPTSPEASLSKAELDNLKVSPSKPAAKTAPARRRP